ncbi:MAG: UPF0280 family protein [Rhodobacteraceae bacterium]|nr:UPF0280 family protein [Paracoccaceae bacterium]
MTVQVQHLPDGRLHLNHGPIDLICEAWGEASAVQAGYRRAVARFRTVLEELVAELPLLRRENAVLNGPIARKMAAAVAPFRPAFITPMAAVAGSVAETILAEIAAPGVRRAYVNNGGDIALHLTLGSSLTCAMAQGGHVTISADLPVRGIATSGWRGRSWSLGIADAVTVLAHSAAMADAAATMIANAVNLADHPEVLRRPAVQMQAESDLGHRLVTVGVGPLAPAEVNRALGAGLAAARDLAARGLIEGAALFLQGQVRTHGQMLLPKEAELA